MVGTIKTIISIILWPLFFVTFVFGVLGYFIVTTFVSLNVAHRYMKIFCRTCLLSAGQFLKIKGIVPPRDKQPYIYMLNHQSMFDHFMIAGSTSHYLTGVAAEDQYSYPVYGAALRRYKAIPIKRKKLKDAIHSLDEAEKVVLSGTSLLIAPEGTRTVSGELGTFKKGPFHLAINTKATIIPVAIIGAWEAKKKTDWKLKPGVITIHYGDPIQSTQYDDYSIQELSNFVKNELQKLISGG
ncbi:MAG: lysophospholipid acyltransferase family protein [Candidatus Marinimicrobia bacterium]|nr:lysophospholipid acyltransferase family protein [Candidatus Neomarinimicrobiota bacterium]